ncbi:MAG: HAMP domain-containing sensor histidine kinase [Firmicutes bacterium]|nr:HAMP domain-containing sensor histidine kinase [Bacillota bacterium]
MGRRPSGVARSIKSQVILGVVRIAVLSVISTLMTFFVLSRVIFAGPNGDLYAKHTAQYVQRVGPAILSTTHRVVLDRLLPPVWGTYQVMNAQGTPLYGTVTHKLYASRTAVYAHLNVVQFGAQPSLRGAVSAQLLPVFSAKGLLVGAVYMQWKTHSGTLAQQPMWVMDLLLLLLMGIPFLYIGLFTYLFARRFSRRINRPIGLLVQAAKKMQMRDLDFTIDYHEANEIGQLLAAFEEMRLELREALVRQWGLEDERREMLAAISHDLRTPVTIVQGHAELLAEMPDLSEIAHRHIGAIVRSGQRIARLLHDFQTVTAIGSPAFTLCAVEVDLPAFLTARLAEFEVMAQDGVRVEHVLTDKRPYPTPVSIDPDRLAQIMDNIWSNALHHTPHPGLIVWHMTVRAQSLTVRVHDSGPGFKQADLHRVLDPFYRSDPGRAGDHAGLGLYIVRELSRRHGGDVRVWNHDEGGAVVEFWLDFLTK